jgi:two-component system sensor histidine kinase DegS
LVALLSITYVRFFVIPYLGFYIDQNRIIIKVTADDALIEIGDKLIKFDHFTIDEFFSSPRPAYLQDYSPGDEIELVVEKPDGEIETVNWTIAGSTREAFLYRLKGLWLIPYIFWAFGTITILIVRPRDKRWVLFFVYNYLTAVWFSAGNDLSNVNIWFGSIILKVFVWLSIPVFLQLHFEFFKKRDRPLPKLSVFIIRFLYFLFGIIALLELFYLPPDSLYQNAFNASLVFSIVYLIVQYFRVKELRNSISIIFRFSLIAFLPTILVALFSNLTSNPIFDTGMTIIALPILPISYFFAIFYKRLGNFEFRANRLITLYFYIIFIIAASIVIFGAISLATDISSSGFLIGIVSMFAASLVTALFYDRFQRFVERRILRIKIPEEELLNDHLTYISTTLDLSHLAANIQDYCLPSLLIRQSSILNINDHKISTPLFTFGIENDQLPDSSALDLLLKNQGKFIFPRTSHFNDKSLNWIRLVLPLNIKNELIDIWLFGDRDPDNFYSAREIENIKSIVTGTAIAMINAEQSENLVHLYRSRITREELNRARLSRDIHDIALNNLAAIKKNIPDKKIDSDLTGVINDLRLIIHDLRPELISFGLITALEDLVNKLNSHQQEIEVQVEIDDRSAEIDERITIQAYRIIRQACENALKHAECKNILIQGQITSDFIVINVIDDGVGFEMIPSNNFKRLLEQKHYGIVGMHERASLIGATLQINSEIGSGSVISFRWKK